MYLSRIRLNIDKRQTQVALVSLNKLHGAIENSFQQHENAERERKLWRVDTLNGNIYLLILSQTRPNLELLISQYGYPNGEYEVKDYDKLLNRIANDSVWRFRIVANPTKSLSKKNERGKVVAHITPQYQLKWLESKAEKNGFELVDGSCQVVSSGWRIFDKQNKGKIRILSAAFEGMLRVKDVDSFKKALIDGIGREKAYGMGLMTIIKAGRNE